MDMVQRLKARKIIRDAYGLPARHPLTDAEVQAELDMLRRKAERGSLDDRCELMHAAMACAGVLD